MNAIACRPRVRKRPPSKRKTPALYAMAAVLSAKDSLNRLARALAGEGRAEDAGRVTAHAGILTGCLWPLLERIADAPAE